MKLVGFFFFVLISLSGFTFAAGGDTQTELDRNRSSTPYKKQIFETLSRIENKKWTDGGADGFIIIHDTTPREYNWKEEYYEAGVFVKVQRFYYGKLLKEYPGYVRQSKWNGYIEIYNEENRSQQLHIRMVDDDTFNLYFHDYPSEKRFVLKHVGEFNKDNPYKSKETRSKEDRWKDLIF